MGRAKGEPTAQVDGAQLIAHGRRYGHRIIRNDAPAEPAMGSLHGHEIEPGLRLHVVDAWMPAGLRFENLYASGSYFSLCHEGDMRLTPPASVESLTYGAESLAVTIGGGDAPWISETLSAGRFRSLCVEASDAWMQAHGGAASSPIPCRIVPASRALMRLSLAAFTLRGPHFPADERMRLKSIAYGVLSEGLRLCAAVEAAETAAPRAADLDRLAAARALIENNCGRAWTIEDLARLAGLTEKRLKAGFRQAFGATVFAHLQSVRMAKAQRLLQSGGTVTDVAFEVGYAHPGSFSRAYRGHFGCSPRSEIP